MKTLKLPIADRNVVNLAIVASILLVTWQLCHFGLYAQIYSGRNASSESQATFDPCRHVSGLEDVLVVMKTGATETESKLPVHFNTTLLCVPHWVVYSDFDERVEHHDVYNALDLVDDQIKMTHPDFDLYNRLQHEGKAAINQSELDSWSRAANTPAGTLDNPAWRLDKWKFLPLVDKALDYRPNATWFVFLEADTYISWPALVAWLSHFDKTKPFYLGNQMEIGNIIFGHGGSGFILSGPAMRMAQKQHAEKSQEYDALTSEHWAGDCVLGKVLADAGVNLAWSWPNLVGDFAKIDYAAEAYDKRLGCYHSVSHHHLSPEEIRDLWEFEQSWYHKVRSLTPIHGPWLRCLEKPTITAQRFVRKLRNA